jgi:CrcB protein
MIRTLLCIAIGGSVGSILRYLTALAIEKYYGTFFPLATFLVNIAGCLIIGLTMGWLEKNQLMNSNLKWLLVTGFCGGFTTFSAFGYENIQLLQNNNMGMAFLYIGGSIIVGLGSVWLGLMMVK